VTRTWYRVALARDGHAPIVVAAAGEHIGAALDVARASLAGSWAVAADAVSGEDAVPLGDAVGKSAVVQLGEAPAGTSSFRWPHGVVPKLGSTLVPRRGWTVRADPELLVMEAQTDSEHQVDLFLGMVERLPTADNLEVKILAHYDDVPTGATEVWLTSRIDARKVLRFLDEHDRDLIENGFVEVSVYVRKHKATLRLTEHKTVVWLAEAGALEAEVARWFGELEVPRAEQLVTVSDAPHFHTRPGKSFARKKLGEELFKDRMRRVARIS
jgi:hypothetical protein